MDADGTAFDFPCAVTVFAPARARNMAGFFFLEVRVGSSFAGLAGRDFVPFFRFLFYEVIKQLPRGGNRLIADFGISSEEFLDGKLSAPGWHLGTIPAYLF